MIDFIETFEVPLYPGHLSVIRTDNFDDCYELADIDRDKYHLDMDTDHADAITFDHPEDRTRVFIAIMSDTPSDVVVHECTHAANIIFKYAGIEVDLSNDEPYAYLVQWVFASVQKSIRKNTSRREILEKEIDFLLEDFPNVIQGK